MEVRRITQADEEAYRGILLRTSDEDRFFRFFHAVNDVEQTDIIRFVTPQPDIVGILATDGDQALGAAHAFLELEHSAEFSIVVASDARRRGVARALLTRLAFELRDLGVVTLTAYSLAENTAFARLARSLGMAATHDANTTTWRLPLDDALFGAHPRQSIAPGAIVVPETVQVQSPRRIA